MHLDNAILISQSEKIHYLIEIIVGLINDNVETFFAV